MKKLLPYAALFTAALLLPAVAHAQIGGCGDSPENPTLILAGLASGAFGISQLRTRLRARRRTNDTSAD